MFTPLLATKLYTPQVQRMKLAPGDVIVCRAEQPVRPEFRVYLEKQLRAAFPGHRVVVLAGPVEVFVMGEAEVLAAGEGGGGAAA